MPQRAAKPCAYPGCNALVRGKARCVAHQRDTRNYRTDARRRGSARKRGYDTQWDKVRRRHVAQFPLCQDCLDEGRVNASTIDVDHIVPFQGLNDPKRLDPTNLRSLCRMHHNRKTARQGAR